MPETNTPPQNTPSPKANRGESRERILEAATEEFAQKGFAGARVDTIARKTQLNVRMIYYHFKSKEALYQEVLLSIYRQMAALLLDSASLARVEPGGAVAAFSRYIDLLAANPLFAVILIREAVDGGKELGKLFSDHPELRAFVHERAAVYAEANIQAGHLRKVDAALSVHGFTSMVCLLIATRAAEGLFVGGREVSMVQWKEVLVDLFAHGIATTR